MLLLAFLVAATQWKAPSVHILNGFSMVRVLNADCACGGHVVDVSYTRGGPEAPTMKCSQGSLDGFLGTKIIKEVATQ